MDFLSPIVWSLPDEIWVYILSFLGPEDIQRFLLTSKRYQNLHSYFKDVLTQAYQEYYYPASAVHIFMHSISKELDYASVIGPLFTIPKEFSEYMGLSPKNWPYSNNQAIVTQNIFQKWWFLYVYFYGHVRYTKTTKHPYNHIHLNQGLIKMFSDFNPYHKYMNLKDGISFKQFEVIMHHILMSHSGNCVDTSVCQKIFLYRQEVELNEFLISYPSGDWKFRRRLR